MLPHEGAKRPLLAGFLPVERWIANLWKFKDGKLVSIVDVFASAKVAVAATL